MTSPTATTLTGRRGLWRWTVALVATVALVVSGSGLVVFAQSGSGESKGPQFVPADAPIYIEARLDMPAGQDESLAQMLTAFPGFADAGMFDTKMNELIAGVAGDGMPDGNIIGDALTGEIGIAMTDLESALDNEEPTMLMGMAIADPDMADAMTEALVTGQALDGEISQEMLGDTTIVTDLSSSAAVYGDWMLFSNDADELKAAIDVLDGNAPSLADDADFAAAFSRVPAARLGAAYVDLQAFGGLIDSAGSMASGQVGMELPLGDIAAMLPLNMVAYLAAENDRLTLEAFMTPGDMTPDVPVGESDLANVFPADTQLYIELRELGSMVETGLTGVAELMAEQQALAPADGGDGGVLGDLSDLDMLFSEDSPITSMLGVPLTQFLDVVEDAGIGAGMSSDGLWLGIAGELSDEALGATRMGKIATMVTLFGGDPAETGISISTDMVGDVEVTTFTLPMEEMVAGSGLSISVGDTISMAVADSTLLIGLGDFVQSVLASDGSDSLGSSAGYIDALGEDTVNGGVIYADISSLLTELTPMLQMMSPEWAEIAPYATGLDRMIAVATVDDEVVGARMSIIVGQ
jgi:hypothetical protein